MLNNYCFQLLGLDPFVRIVLLLLLFNSNYKIIKVITWPHAINIAVTIFAACALNPPILPAIAEPTRFLLIFKSTNALTDVFNTDFTISPLTMASQITDFPRPSILFIL